LSALRAGRPLPPRKIPGTNLLEAESVEKIQLIGTVTRHHPACSIVPQPTTLPHAPRIKFGQILKKCCVHSFSSLRIQFMGIPFGYGNEVADFLIS
jgi:hypothetical protein